MWLSASEELLSGMTASSVQVSFDLKEVGMESVQSDNVVGYLPGSDPDLKDEFIVFSAHYDHVGQGNPDATGDNIYNGARDNGVGTTGVLMLAEYLKSYPLKRSALFVLFTGEEKGLLGSRYFVNHSPVELSSIKYCMNIDNAGYNDTTIVSVIGLTRTEAEDAFITAAGVFGLGAIEDAAKEQGLFDRSDNVNFARKGIPAPTFSLGFRGFDAEIMKYYHQPGDDLESLNLNYILRYIRSYLLASELIGNADNVPFWNEGDKYYPIGKELYMTAPEKEEADH
jgi:Zn-dependent M28 family amino/carboxypeptidase